MASQQAAPLSELGTGVGSSSNPNLVQGDSFSVHAPGGEATVRARKRSSVTPLDTIRRSSASLFRRSTTQDSSMTGDDTASLASRKTHSRGPSLSGGLRNITNKFKNRNSGDFGSHPDAAFHSLGAGGGHDGLPASAAAGGSQIAERDHNWNESSFSRPPATAPATMTEVGADHPLPPLPSRASSDVPPRVEAPRRPSHSRKPSVAAAAALAIPHAAGVIGGAPGGAQAVKPPPPPASSENGHSGSKGESSESLLTPLYKYMQHRERSQRRTVSIFFAAAGVCAVLTAHLGQHFTRTAFFSALVGVFVIGYVLTKQLERQAGDDRYIVDAQVRQILAERGFSNEEIAQLESGRNVHGATDRSDANHSRESVEWVNSILALVWPVIGPDYFAPFVDLMEDALMQQVPGIVHSARVNDLDQGSLPLRLKSFVVLSPDADAFLAVDEDPTKVKYAPPKPADAAQNVGAKDQQFSQGAEAEEMGDTGDYINLEVDFVYRAPSTVETRGKSNKSGDFEGEAIVPDEVVVHKGKDKIHMLLNLDVGIKKLAAISVPVWIEVLGIEGKMRLRLQITPVLPFVKNVAFTLIGKPRLEISAKPLGRKMVIDAMQLPLISTYVLHSIEAVLKDFICPKQYTVDVGSILGSGEGPQHPYAVGLIGLVIHQAKGLPAADANGKADPFVQAAFSKSGRPLFSTRVVRKTRDPIWQECGFLPVSPDEIRSHDSLRLTVYDADRFSVDDPLGKIDLPLAKLIEVARRREGRSAQVEFECRTSPLESVGRGSSKAEGWLKFSVAYFPLSTSESQNDTSVQKKETDDAQVKLKPLEDYMTGFDRFVARLGAPIDTDLLQARQTRDARVSKLIKMISGAEEQQAKPPMPEFLSGIVVYHIHTVQNLETRPPQKTLSGNSLAKAERGMRPRSVIDDVSGDASKLPSSYCYVVLNDEPVLRTRTSVLNAHPYFNAGGERFIPDWRTCRLDFVVKDQRMRENDATLGLVSVKLGELLKDGGVYTGWHNIVGGLGFGKIKISVLFRSFNVQIPAPLRGCGVGVVEIAKLSAVVRHDCPAHEKDLALVMETYGCKTSTSTTPALPYKDGSQFQWSISEPMRMAVRSRYPSLLYLDLVSEKRGPGKRPRWGHAVVALNHVSDLVPTTLKVPIFQGEEDPAVEQTLFRAMTLKSELILSEDNDTVNSSSKRAILEEFCQSVNRDLPDEVFEKAGVKRVGTLEINLVFFPGIAPEHRSLVAGDGEMRVAWDTYLAGLDSGGRPKPKNVSLLAKAMHEDASSSSSPPEGRSSNDLYDPEVPATYSDLRQGDESDEEDEEADPRVSGQHRNERGAAQIKGFRTAQWLKRGIEDQVSKIKNATGEQKRFGSKLDNEAVSHF